MQNAKQIKTKKSASCKKQKTDHYGRRYDPKAKSQRREKELMKKSVALMALVAVVYMLPLGAGYTWQQELIIKSALSMGLALTALALSKKPCFIVIAGCEILALLYNTILALCYSFGPADVDWLYGAAMDSLFAVEILALSLGMLDEFRRLQLDANRNRYRRGANKNTTFLGQSLQ